jgi:hypothetical protein
MPTTAKGLRYPSATSAPNIPQDVQNLANDVDAWLGYRYYDEGGGASFAITTTPTAMSDPATLSLPAGTYDFDIRGAFALSVSTSNRQINLHLFSGATEIFATSFRVTTTGGSADRVHSDFVRRTLSATATVTLRVSADTTGGTQAITANSIRAVRVS